MNEIIILDQREVLGIDFKIYGTKENPLFLAKDVATFIKHSKVNMMLENIDEEEKLKEAIFTSGQKREMWFLTEYGLYEVLMQSRKPIAKEFKKEVKHILKQIRQTGGYIPIEQNMTDAEIMAKALLISQKTIEQKDKLIEEMKPKALFAEAVSTSHTTILIGELAKILKQNGIETGQKRLFEYLRNEGFLIKRKGVDYNMPTQKSMELGLFEIKETTINHSDGHISISKTPKVTGKGQIYFVNKFKNN